MTKITPEEMEQLVMLAEKMGVDLTDLTDVRKPKKSKGPAKELYIGKYERVFNKCTLCNTEWYDYFAMRKYDDDTLRSKRIEVHEIPAGAKLEQLVYKHRHCNKCREILPKWSKEDLVNVILYDRKNNH